MKIKHLLLSLTLIVYTFVGYAQMKKNADGNTNNYWLKSSQLSGLKFRSIGPALTSGRISDIAVNPHNFNEYYVAVASGGVWKLSLIHISEPTRPY